MSDAVGPPVVVAFLASLRTQPLAASSIARVLSAIKQRIQLPALSGIAAAGLLGGLASILLQQLQSAGRLYAGDECWLFVHSHSVAF